MGTVISLQTELASKERELVAARSSDNTLTPRESSFPSFELLSQGLNDSDNSETKLVNQGDLQISKNSQSTKELNNELQATKAKLALCEEQIKRIQHEKLKEIEELGRKNIVMRKELNGQRRANEGIRGMCAILVNKIDEAQQTCEEIQKKEDSYKKQIDYTNQLYEEQMFKMRMVQAILDTMQPPILKQNVIISAPTKNIRAWHEEKREGKKTKILDYFEPSPTGGVRTTEKIKLSKMSTRFMHAATNAKGKTIKHEPIFISDETDDEDNIMTLVKRGKTLNLHKLRISNYLTLDTSTRLEGLWARTSMQ